MTRFCERVALSDLNAGCRTHQEESTMNSHFEVTNSGHVFKVNNQNPIDNLNDRIYRQMRKLGWYNLSSGEMGTALPLSLREMIDHADQMGLLIRTIAKETTTTITLRAVQAHKVTLVYGPDVDQLPRGAGSIEIDMPSLN